MRSAPIRLHLRAIASAPSHLSTFLPCASMRAYSSSGGSINFAHAVAINSMNCLSEGGTYFVVVLFPCAAAASMLIRDFTFGRRRGVEAHPVCSLCSMARSISPPGNSARTTTREWQLPNFHEEAKVQCFGRSLDTLSRDCVHARVSMHVASLARNSTCTSHIERLLHTLIDSSDVVVDAIYSEANYIALVKLLLRAAFYPLHILG